MGSKKIILIIIGVFIILAGVMGVNVYKSAQETSKEIAKIEINNLDLSKVNDGVYEGEYFYSDLLGAKVEVTVKSNGITEIEFIEHNYGTGKKAEEITNKVIEKQSLNVDTISGATSSSTVILKAIENALSK